MLRRGRGIRQHRAGSSRHLVLYRAGDDMVLALHERCKAVARDLGGIILFAGPDLVSCIPARSKNSVSVGPGISAVTVTPVSRNSSRSAWANDETKDLDALYTELNGPGRVAAIEEVNRTRPQPGRLNLPAPPRETTCQGTADRVTKEDLQQRD